MDTAAEVGQLIDAAFMGGFYLGIAAGVLGAYVAAYVIDRIRGAR